jgi:hypothetical protein
MADNIINFNGFVQITQLFNERLISRKKVALFTDYEHTKEDIIMEFLNMGATKEGCEQFIRIIESETDVKEYFEKL